MNGNSRDGYLDRLVFRRLAAPLTRLLLRARWSPNAVTVFGTLLGIGGGLALALAWPLGAALAVGLLACSSVLDCSDGELARLRHRESRVGHVLDVTGDTLVHGAVFAGLVLALRRAGASPDPRTLIALAAGVVAAFAAITWCEATEGRRRRVASWENRVLDGALAPLTTRDWYVFPLGFALTGRLDALVTGAAVGAQVFWVSVTVLVARALRRSAA